MSRKVKIHLMMPHPICSKNDSAASKGIVPKTSATQMPRRSRFPKARPNVADAARRKQK